MNQPFVVLFICQHNAGRSQLGAHLLDLVAPGQFRADSAGVDPADEINPIVAEALNEVGADSSRARPRLVTEADLAKADVVVTMKLGLELPGPIRGRHVEWEFRNPQQWDLDGVRSMRDSVTRAVRNLAEQLAESP